MPREKRPPSRFRRVFGERLKLARKAQELTIFDVAYLARVDWSYVVNIESGKQNPSLDVMDALAQAVGIPLPEMFRMPEEIQGNEDLE